MAENRLLSKVFGKEGRKGIQKDALMVFITLLLIFALALFLRSYFGWHEATKYGAPFLVSGGSDSYYHERAIYTAAYEHHSLFKDSMLNYPIGSRNPRPPAYDWSVTLGGYLLSPLVGDLGAALSYSLIISTAFWGALTIFPTYLIGKKAFNRRVGLISAFLLAVMPAHLARSQLTDADHDAFVLFFVVTSIYFLIVAMENMKEREWVESWRDFTSVKTGFRNMFRENRKAFLYAFLSASSALTIALTWKGFSYLYAIFFLYFMVQLFVNRFRNIDPSTLTVVASIVLFVPVILSAPYYIGAILWTWLLAPTVMASIVAITGIYFSLTKRLPWTLDIPMYFIGIAILFLFALIFFPSIIETVGRQTGYFTRSKLYKTIAEAQAPYFSNMVLSFGPVTFFFALLGVGWILWKMRKNWSPNFVLVVLWSTESIYMALSAARFMFNAAPAFAIASGWLTYYIIKKTDFGYMKRTYRSLRGNKWYAIKKSVKVTHVLVALFLVFMVIMPNVWYAVDAGIPSNNKKEYDREIYNAMPDFLRPNSTLFNSSSKGTWYLGAFGYSLPTPNQYWPAAWKWFAQQDSSLLPEDRPGFLSWWDYGFECIQQGKHPAVADNFQYGYQIAGSFIMAQNETEAIALLSERILDSQFDTHTKKFTDEAIELMKKYFGDEDTKTIEDIYANPESYVPQILAHPEKYGPYDSQIDPLNARYIATRGVLLKYGKEYLVEFLHTLEDKTGKRIGYFAIDSRLIPFSARNTGIFYAPAVLSDRRMSSGGYRMPYDFYEIYAVTTHGKKYPINDVPDSVRRDINYTEIEYKDMFYNTMLYRNYFGYSPKEAGSNKNGLPGLSSDLRNMQPMPAWNLTHFRLVYRTVYWNPYKDYKNHTNAWQAIGLDEGLKYRKEGKGVVDISPGTLYNGVTFLEYYEGAIINGTVETPEGVPVGKIRVTVYDEYGIPHQSVITDKNGRFSLIAPFGNITIIASNGGSLNKVRMSEKNVLNRTTIHISMYQAERKKMDLDGDGTWDYLIHKDLIASTSSVKGTVFLDMNNDKKKQDLETGREAKLVLYGKTVDVNYTVETNSTGTYEIKDVIPGDYGIKMTIGAYQTDTNLTVSVEPNKEKQQHVPIPTGSVKGKLTKDDGRPFSNQELYLLSTDDDRNVSFSTDEKGEFFVDGVIPGTYTIVPSNHTYSPSSYIVGVFENQTSNINLTVYPGCSLDGYLNIYGKGVPYVTINFINYTFPEMSRSVVTEEGGHYSVALAEGDYDVIANYISNTTRYVLLKHISVVSEKLSMSFEMVKPEKVSGYIRYYSPTLHSYYYKDEFPVTFVGSDGSRIDTYSIKGNYTAYLPPGRYHVYVSHVAAGFPYAFSGEINVDSDQILDINLTKGVVVQGYVKGVENTTVRAASIHFTSDSGENFYVISNETGYYRFILQPGAYTANVKSRFYKPYEMSLNLSTEPRYINVSMAPKEVRVYGNITCCGSSVGGVNISFSGYNSSFTALSDENGNYSIVIPAGRYIVSVEQNISSDGSERYELTHKKSIIVSPENSPMRNNLEIEKRMRVSGSIYLNGNKVNDTLTIWVSRNDTTIPYTSSNGSFEIYLPPGRYVINSTYDNRTYGIFEGISVNSPMHMDLNLSRLYFVSITMTSESKTKVGIPLNLYSPSGAYVTIHPEGNGVLVYLPYGTYPVKVNYTTMENVEGMERNVTYTANSTIRVMNDNVTMTLNLNRYIPEGDLRGVLYMNEDVLSNHHIDFISTDTGEVYAVSTDDSGEYQLSAPMGAYVVYSVAYSGDNPYSIMEKIVVGEHSEKDIYLKPAVTFSGRTIKKDSTGIKTAISMINLTDQSIQKRFDTDERGNFNIIVPPGMYSVVANGTAEIYGVNTTFIYQEDINLTYSMDRDIVMEMTKIHKASLSWDSSEKASVYPGTNVTYDITVKNEGNCKDTYSFSGSPWAVDFSPSNVTLNPQESANISVVIHVPEDAKLNHEPVKISANVQGEEKGSVDVSVDIKPTYGASASISKSYWETGNALYEIVINNTGNVDGTFTLSISNMDDLEAEGWNAEISATKDGNYSGVIDSINISADSNTTIYAKFIPKTSRPAYSPEIKLRIISDNVDKKVSLSAPLPSIEIRPNSISVEGDNLHIWEQRPFDMGPIYWSIGILVALGAIYWVLKKKGVIL